MRIVTAETYQAAKRKQDQEHLAKIDAVVLEIIKKIRNEGDEALLAYAKQFDNVTLSSLKVTEKEFSDAEATVSPAFADAIETAANNITAFHEGQLEKSWFMTKPNGVLLGQQVTAMEKVGVYIPGGKAAYPSTVLMNVIPARLAGVSSIAIATPPQKNGTINPHVLAAAKHVGIDKVYKMGGAQAIAAFAYGTETVEQVDKIVGPGNDFVARAKKWVYGDVAIDMIAGPSEICVVADKTAPAQYVAADLLSQAEHDEAAKAVCVTFSEAMAKEIQGEVRRQLEPLERKSIAAASIEQHGAIIVVDSLDEAFAVVNDLAPEHLQLMIANATDHFPAIRHAGAIFLGNYAPEPLGDYVAGPNHTLPTSGTARFASPLGVYDFMKKSSIIRYSEAALLKEADAIEALAKTEGLDAHANSISIRRKDDRS